jgi:hypothetical protein
MLLLISSKVFSESQRAEAYANVLEKADLCAAQVNSHTQIAPACELTLGSIMVINYRNATSVAGGLNYINMMATGGINETG